MLRMLINWLALGIADKQVAGQKLRPGSQVARSRSGVRTDCRLRTRRVTTRLEPVPGALGFAHGRRAHSCGKVAEPAPDCAMTTSERSEVRVRHTPQRTGNRTAFGSGSRELAPDNVLRHKLWHFQRRKCSPSRLEHHTRIGIAFQKGKNEILYCAVNINLFFWE